MPALDLSPLELGASLRALEYWVGQWDWECPTLFGLEREEFQSLLHKGPAGLSDPDEPAALALIGAWRELLLGASAVRAEQIPVIVGLPYTDAVDLLERLRPQVDLVLRHG